MLHALGIKTWRDAIDLAHVVPATLRENIVNEAGRCLEALESGDISYFVGSFAPKDRWRILAHYLDEVSFFDIETAGLEFDDPITVIACWHRGEVHLFVEHENLDDFLALLDDVKLLSSFNGSSFDVPRVLDAFHIPKLPCPHLDLRWLCYHQGLRGGLKEIAFKQGLHRPHDLACADGELAIRLWARWHHFQDAKAKADLLRYCASDVLLLVLLSESLAGRTPSAQTDIWSKLPGCETSEAAHSESSLSEPPNGAFGPGSPAQLRGRRRMVG